MRARRSLTVLVWALTGCRAVVPVPPDPPMPSDLPESREELLAITDKLALGPGGPDVMRAQKAAEKAVERDPSDREAHWRLARALYFRTMKMEEAASAEIAGRCMAASERATVEPSTAIAFLFRGLCIGARIKAKRFEAIGLLPKMVEIVEVARKKDERVLYAGPLRVLGGIYLRAPAWPTSIGDLDAALEFLEKAASAGPEWAENHMLFAEALIEDGQLDKAKSELDHARRTIEAPIAQYWREVWAADLERLERRLAEENE